MESKKAITILMDLLKGSLLSAKEKEAVLAAIGALDCANLAESRMKSFIRAKKAKRDKSMEL
jgi:hypothetical protein